MQLKNILASGNVEDLVSIPQAVSTVATYTIANILLYCNGYVSIPQAVSTVATVVDVCYTQADGTKVSIPQAVSTVATILDLTKEHVLLK